MPPSIQTVSRGSRTVYAAAELPRDQLLRLVEYPELPLNRGPAEIIKAGNSALVVRTELALGPLMKSIMYKRVTRKTWVKQVTQSLGVNRTLRTFLVGHKLLERGVPTARPLAVIVPGRFQLGEPSYLATEWLTGAENLDACVRSKHTGQSRSIRAIANATGELLGKLHAAGAAHRDLKSQNLMVRYAAQTATADLFAVDLDGVSFPAQLTDSIRWRNLSRLAVCEQGWKRFGPATRLRVLQAYLTAAGRSRAEWKREWRGIAAATAVRQERRAA